MYFDQLLIWTRFYFIYMYTCVHVFYLQLFSCKFSVGVKRNDHVAFFVFPALFIMPPKAFHLHQFHVLSLLECFCLRYTRGFDKFILDNTGVTSQLEFNLDQPGLKCRNETVLACFRQRL